MPHLADNVYEIASTEEWMVKEARDGVSDR